MNSANKNIYFRNRLLLSTLSFPSSLIRSFRTLLLLPQFLFPLSLFLHTGPLYFMYDHCFTLAGKGCVMTGTVQSGKLAVNDEIEFPSLRITRKVKSIQMFHKNIDCAYKGDRAGVCVQYVL